MKFSRGRRSAGKHAQDRRRGPGAPDTARDGTPPVNGTTPPAPGPAPAGGAEERIGPYDSGEAPPAVTRLDLGSLRIPSVSGVRMNVQANQQGVVQRVMLAHGDSMLHLMAVAAPRTEPLWDEVREDIRRSLAERQVAVEEFAGDYGPELRARVPTKDGAVDVRFVGVDGPRWMVRADFQGPAARDPERSPQLTASLRGLVVHRGTEAKPAKEPLPLRLTPEMAAQVQQQAAAAGRRSPPPPDGQPVVDRM